MGDITTILVVLGIVLAIVTLVGHGIWVLLAAVFGGKPSQRKSDAAGGPGAAERRACPRCGTALAPVKSSCDVCGWPARLAQPSSQAALRSVREQVERLAQLGLVDAVARDKMVAAVAAEELRVAAAEVEAAVAAKPQATPVVEAKPQAAEIPVAELAPPVAHASLGDRARKYAASREAAAAEALAEPVAPAPAPPKRREAISRLLAAFMEEKNIRWGELVGGLLIVGCSIALVISFWSQIAERPLLKFGLFNGVTAALFGMGLYTDRRWKIHTTSHGILLIAALLVPLNFLAIAAFTDETPPTDLVALSGEAVSLVVFAALVFLAGRILVPDNAPLFVAGVMIPSLMQLLVRRFAEPTTPLLWLYALAVAPIAVYLASTSLVARRRWTPDPSPGSITRHPLPEGEGFSETHAQRLLAFLGVVSFATFVPLALLAYKVPPLYGTLHRLSPLVVTCGLPAMLIGLLFWRHVAERRFSGLQTAGICVGVLGALVMIGAVVLAWPEPATLLPTALVTAAVLTIVAVWFGIPAAHVPAGLALAGAWLIGFHLVRGNVTWLMPSYEPVMRALLSATSGHALVPLVGMFGAFAWWSSRRRQPAVAWMIGLVTAVVAAASLGLVLWFGFGRFADPENVTWTLAIYAVGALTAAAFVDRASIAWVAAVLLFATLVQGIVFRFGPIWQLERPRLTALLAYATLAVALCGGLRWLVRRGQQNLQPVLAWSALAASLAAAGLLTASVSTTSATALAIHLAWLAAVWLVLAALARWPALVIASQVAVVLAIACGVTAAVETRDWYVVARHPWLDPWFLESLGVALAGYCLVMNLVRRRWAAIAKPLAAGWSAGWTVERVVEIGLVLLLASVATYAVLPGAAQELEPLQAARGSAPAVREVTPIENFQIAGIAHGHAADQGGWALLVAVAAVMAVGLWSGGADWRLIGLLVAAMAICPLVAARWEPDVAVASALRWLTAGFYALVSIPVWMRRQWGISAFAKPQAATTQVRDFLVAVVVLVYVAMGAYVFQAALWRAGVPTSLAWLWPYLLAWALVAGVTALLAPRVAAAQQTAGERVTWGLHVRDVLLLLAIAPLAILVTFAAAMALDQHPIVGPNLGSWFREIGWDVSYGVPLAVIALVFVGYAVRDRSSRLAFAAGLLFNTVATIVVLMRLARGGGSLGASAWITVAQMNAIVAGVVALAWLAATRERRATSDEQREEMELLAPRSLPDTLRVAPRWPLLLVTQAALAAALCGTFLIPAVVSLAFEPRLSAWVGAADGIMGWCAVALATTAAVWINGRRGVSQNGVALITAALVALISVTATHWNTGNWFAFRTLMIGLTAAAWLVPPATRAANRILTEGAASDTPLVWSAIVVRLFALAAVLMALGSAPFSRDGVEWAISVLVVIAARNVWIAWYERRRSSLWLAAVLFNGAAMLWWDEFGAGWLGVPGSGTVEGQELLWVNAIALAAMGLVSVWVERWRIAPLTGEARSLRGIALHRFAAWAVILMLLVAAGGGLLRDLFGRSSPTNLPVAWAAWLAAALVAVACCWDRAVRWPIAAMYCVGLIGVGQFLDGLNFQPPRFHWALALALAAYSLATSSLWSVRDRLRAVAERWGMPAAAAKPQAAWHEGSGHGWLMTMNFLLGVGVLMLVWWIELTMETRNERMVAAYAVGAQAFALGLLARGAVRTSLQYLALVWGVFFAVAFGWAWLPPDYPAPWLHRLVVSVAALAVTVVVYGFGLVKFLRRENEWTRAAARLVPLLATLAVSLILAVLGIEVAEYLGDGEVPIKMSALVTVCIALVGLAAAALVAALVPGRDPLGLPERGRTLYVYVAEALAALLFLHIRVTLPWLFTGWFLRFWPLVVMAIAFVGVGLGELFQRRRQAVLSEPLQNTGALLPLLPALGFWVTTSEVHYSLLLLSIGVLYAALSVLRKSFGFGVLAAVAANGSLWYLLFKGEGLGLLEHPQLWLIPPALSMLAAGYINRERLTSEQSTALRYFSAIVIYVSSTADIFISGVAEAPWLPAVLAGLSIVGVLTGIMLRVRAFLYLGTMFLVIALMTIIWHAAEQRFWVWLVAGIVTGVAILALFGLFEKRRDDVLRMVEKMKHWEA